MIHKTNFAAGDYVVYPSHGVGKVVNITEEMIAEFKLSCYVVEFEKDKLTLSIPIKQALKAGLRKLSTEEEMKSVLFVLKMGNKKMKGMWSRRAQEYEEKINSGDIKTIAEVLRDLTRDVEDADRSYSERIIYETALYRISSEYAIVSGMSIETAKEKIISISKDKLAIEEERTANEE